MYSILLVILLLLSNVNGSGTGYFDGDDAHSEDAHSSLGDSSFEMSDISFDACEAEAQHHADRAWTHFNERYSDLQIDISVFKTRFLHFWDDRQALNQKRVREDIVRQFGEDFMTYINDYIVAHPAAMASPIVSSPAAAKEISRPIARSPHGFGEIHSILDENLQHMHSLGARMRDAGVPLHDRDALIGDSSAVVARESKSPVVALGGVGAGSPSPVVALGGVGAGSSSPVDSDVVVRRATTSVSLSFSNRNFTFPQAILPELFRELGRETPETGCRLVSIERQRTVLDTQTFNVSIPLNDGSGGVTVCQITRDSMVRVFGTSQEGQAFLRLTEVPVDPDGDAVVLRDLESGKTASSMRTPLLSERAEPKGSSCFVSRRAMYCCCIGTVLIGVVGGVIYYFYNKGDL